MHGYRVTLQDADVRVVEANRYVVAEDGTLAVIGGDETVERWDAREWLMIHEFGTRLSADWPPPRLDDLVNEVAFLLAGHYVHRLRDADTFEDWRCNDLDSLPSAMLERIGFAGEDTAEHRSVGELVARHFRVELG
jgi:hypothetical protein